jgi:hypothetical protein
VSIGPVTSETLREHGLEPDIEASRHDIAGVIDAVLADAVAIGGSAEDIGAGARQSDGTG